MGLDPYLVRQGLAFKLNDGPLSEEQHPEGAVQMARSPYISVIGDWVDVPRTRTLLDDVFVQHTGIPDEWRHWPDQSTIGIPNYYGWAYLALMQAAMQRGDEQASGRYQDRAERWMALGT